MEGKEEQKVAATVLRFLVVSLHSVYVFPSSYGVGGYHLLFALSGRISATRPTWKRRAYEQ